MEELEIKKQEEATRKLRDELEENRRRQAVLEKHNKNN